MTLLPQIASEQYEVSPELWTELESEIRAVVAKIQSGEQMTPDDVANVKNLNKRIDEFGTKYNRALTAAGKEYKSRLVTRKTELGYDLITQFIAHKKAEQDAAINARLSAKLEHFNRLLNNALVEHPYINSTGLRETVINNFIGRFPKVNSGAESNEIKNWTPIETVINTSLGVVEEKLQATPVMMQLPIYSQTMKSFSAYLRTGDVSNLDNLTEKLTNDRPLLETVILKSQLQSESDVVAMISSIIASEVSDNEKLAQISKVMTTWQVA